MSETGTKRKAGNWKAVPLGVRMTPAEVAAIVGITRESVSCRFAPSQRRPMPEGFRSIKAGSRFQWIIRDH